MDGNQGPEVGQISGAAAADLGRILAGFPAPADAAAIIDEMRDL